MYRQLILITLEKALIRICGGFLTTLSRFYLRILKKWNLPNVAVISRHCFSFYRFSTKCVLLLTRSRLFWINYLGRNKDTPLLVIIFMLLNELKNFFSQNSFSGIPLSRHEICLLTNFSAPRRSRFASSRQRNTLNEFCKEISEICSFCQLFSKLT